MREKPTTKRQRKREERLATGSPAAPMLFYAAPGLDLELLSSAKASAITEMFRRTVRTCVRNAWNALGASQRAGLLGVEASCGYARAAVPEEVEDAIETELGRRVAGVFRGESGAGEPFACGECSFRVAFRPPPRPSDGEAPFLWETLTQARAAARPSSQGSEDADADAAGTWIARVAGRLWSRLADDPGKVHTGTLKGEIAAVGEVGMSESGGALSGRAAEKIDEAVAQLSAEERRAAKTEALMAELPVSKGCEAFEAAWDQMNRGIEAAFTARLGQAMTDHLTHRMKHESHEDKKHTSVWFNQILRAHKRALAFPDTGEPSNLRALIGGGAGHYASGKYCIERRVDQARTPPQDLEQLAPLLQYIPAEPRQRATKKEIQTRPPADREGRRREAPGGRGRG